MKIDIVSSNGETQISREKIIAFICDELGKQVPPEKILNENTDITTDLSLDSVAIMDLVFAVEEKFDLSISLNALADIYRIGQLADLVFNTKTKL